MKSSNKKLTYFALLISILVAIISSIYPIYPDNQFLQHMGTLVLLTLLVWNLKSNSLSKLSIILYSLFIILHCIGARYIYSFVPYNDWIDLNTYFGWERNHFDRFVHFFFGVSFTPVLMDVFRRKIEMKYAIMMAFFGLQTFSLLYEVFEWLLTVFVSSEAAIEYNGQQGDWWDAQKDMALALVGSLFSILLIKISRKNFTC